MQVPGHQLKNLHSAIEQSFDSNTLDKLLIERWNIQLHTLTAPVLPFPTQVVAVVKNFNAHYTAEELLLALRDARPRNPVFVELADLAGFADLPANLEKFVRPTSTGPAHAIDFRIRLAQCENQVCRVETATQLGTGILVGPNLVLTNYHVVPDIDAQGTLSARASCRFDYRKGSGTYKSPPRDVAVTRALAWSPYASADLQADQVSNDPGKLDYALLELEEDVGGQGIVDSFEARGFARMLPDIVLPISTAILILQHPEGQQLKIDLGTVTALPGMRARHNVNTLAGSSGAPLFDAELRLVGLHHAGFDWPAANQAYNQAIPMSLIVADLLKKKIKLPD